MSQSGHRINEHPKDWEARQQRLSASFLQSSHWASFQMSMGRPIHYVWGEGWSCLLLERKTPFGRYLFAPYGPTLASAQLLKACLKTLKAYGRDVGADWLSLEPMLAGGGSRELKEALGGLGGVKAAHNREPDLTRIIDLTPPADDILASISQSTRSLIRKNQRENLLNFQSSSDPADIRLFTRMLSHVTDRKKVFFFPDDYFQAQAQALMPSGILRLELAFQAGRPVASALFHDYGEMTSYTYAASLPEARQTSASALLLWQSMLNAKQRSIKRLDLFGIAPEDASASHPWQGFSDFKKKFGGLVVSYAGTWDFPLSPRYRLYRAARRLRR